MPYMDGTGPRRAETETGAVCGMRRNGNMRTPGCRRGMGFCRFAGTTERESLENAKTALQQQLDNIEQRLQQL